MGLSQSQRDEAEKIADAAVQRYFNHYLLEVFPGQVAAMLGHHDTNVHAHSGIVRQFSRAKYLVIGAALACGAGLREIVGYL